MGQERRRTPRYPFIASAELIEENSDVRMSTRVSELSLNGCYLDMMNPFPEKTSVLIKIFNESGFFEARATVVYSHPNLGMGVTFHDVKPYFMTILQKWLLEAMKQKQAL